MQATEDLLANLENLQGCQQLQFSRTSPFSAPMARSLPPSGLAAAASRGCRPAAYIDYGATALRFWVKCCRDLSTCAHCCQDWFCLVPGRMLLCLRQSALQRRRVVSCARLQHHPFCSISSMTAQQFGPRSWQSHVGSHGCPRTSLSVVGLTTQLQSNTLYSRC